MTLTLTLTRNLKIERSGISPLRVDLFALFFLLSACSFAKAESKEEYLLDGHYHGKFFIEVNLSYPLHYNVFDNTAHDVSKHLACDGLKAQVQVGITVIASQVTGRTLNLIDASEVGKKCFELLNGDLTDYLDSDGNFRGWNMNSFSKLSSFQPRLTGSIGEGSIFEVKRWNLRSKKFEWMEGAAPDL